MAYSLPSQAATLSFGTNGIKFDQTTQIEFTFLVSNNEFQSALKVLLVDTSKNQADLSSAVPLFEETKQSDNGSANDWLGTCGPVAGTTVKKCTTVFKFEAFKTYTLGLFNTIPSPNKPNDPIVFSTNFTGNPADTFAKFSGSNPITGPVKISFEDGSVFPYANDGDFNDFIISAKIVPISPPLAGLMVFGTLAYLKKRRSVRSQSN